MIVVCTVCAQEREDMKLLESRLLPKVRYICCDICQEKELVPRPHIILALKYGEEGNRSDARKAIKLRRYQGEEISAAEIIDLDQ